MTEYRYRAGSYAEVRKNLYRLTEPEQWTVNIYISRYPVVHHTPKGAWIDDLGQHRFVLNGRGKRFAHEKPEWAVESLRRRTQHYRSRLAARLDRISAVEKWFEQNRDDAEVAAAAVDGASRLW